MITHCLPNGSLGTGEMPCVGLSGRVSVVSTASPGSRRGIVLLMDGIIPVPKIPVPFKDVANANYWLTFANNLAGQGWVVIQPTYPSHLGTPSMTEGMYNDIINDSGHGLRLKNNTVIRWWDHMLQWIKTNYGANFPVVTFGMSWGGWHSLQIAANRTSSIVAYGAHCPVTILSKVNVINPITTALDTTGLDTGAHHLDSIIIPGIIGYHKDDFILGGWQTPQSNIDAIITNQQAAQPAHQMTRFGVDTGNHAVLMSDVTYYSHPTTGWFNINVNPLCPATL